MILESVTSENNLDEDVVSLPFPNTRWVRLIYSLFITILPPFAFWGLQLDKPDWQSGILQDYLKLLLLPEASLLFFPLLVYSIICYILLLIAPFRYASLFLIRVGIYSGVFLALQYSILTLFILEIHPLLIIAGVLPLVLSRVYPWIKNNWNIKFLGVLFISAIVAWYLIAAVIFQDMLMPLFFIAVLFAFISPFWSLILSARSAIWLFKNFEVKITFLRGFGLTAWLAAYITAWRFDILKMYELYYALPTTPPDCYIATAATSGHSSIVGSKIVKFSNGSLIKVNSQLQKLKSVELAIMATFPRLHQWLRQIYNVVGKKLATYIKNPILADVAFLLLVPVEWISFSVLRFFIPEVEAISKKVYSS